MDKFNNNIDKLKEFDTLLNKHILNTHVSIEGLEKKIRRVK